MQTTAEELVDTDFEISVTSTLSDADIVVEVSGHVDIDDENVEDYTVLSNFGVNLMKALKDVNCAFDLDCLSNRKQS